MMTSKVKMLTSRLCVVKQLSHCECLTRQTFPKENYVLSLFTLIAMVLSMKKPKKELRLIVNSSKTGSAMMKL